MTGTGTGVRVAGVGLTPFGVHAERTGRDLLAEAALAALADGEGFYLACPNGHGLLPPRRVCPDCGSREFSAEPLPATGRVETFSEVRVATPAFADEPTVVFRPA